MPLHGRDVHLFSIREGPDFIDLHAAGLHIADLFIMKGRAILTGVNQQLGVVGVSPISPVAIRMTWTALSITSAGRFSPLGPLSILLAAAFRQLLKWGPVSGVAVFVLRHFQLGAVVIADPSAVLVRPTVLYLADSACHETRIQAATLAALALGQGRQISN